MKLVEYKDKKGNRCVKYFCVQFKYNGRSKYYFLGKFLPNIYGVQEAQHEDLKKDFEKKHK